MSRITVRGSSDDIVCIEGDLTDEFHPDNDKPGYLAFSDGTVLSVEYTREGVWRIHGRVLGTAAMTKVEATDPDGDYSDRVTLEGELTWVVFGSHFERIKTRRGHAS